jgi:hypothetical protein
VPRQNRRADPPKRGPAASPSAERREQWRGEEYIVRALAGSASAGRVYRCPGCDQEIRPGLPHVVVWRADDFDAGDRRHWHSSCWAARDHRRPGVQRGRSAPRY